MGQGFFESDEDYRTRTSQEAHERILEESTGTAPSQGLFESDGDYRSRISREADERIVGDSTGSAPSQGLFENDDDYRGRISREAYERVVEDSTGSAPSQGLFESDGDYRSRISREANERVVEDSTGSAPSQGLFEGNSDYRRRVRLEAAESRASGKHSRNEGASDQSTSAECTDTSDYSSSTAPADSSSSAGGSFVLVLIVAAVALAIWGVSTRDQTKPEAAATTPIGEPPAQLVDRGACPYEGCTYGERWMAQRDVDVYFSPPDSIGTPVSSLQRKTVIRAREWVRTETGLVLAIRHEGQVNNDVTVRVDRDSAYHGVIDLKKGQAIYLYSYLGEGCWTSWAEGHFLSFCSATSQGTPRNEWWIKIRTADGSEAWTASADRAFISEEGLNSELGQKIEDPKLPLPDKLAQIDALLKGGAELNGNGGKYGTTPIDAAIRTKDVELLRILISKGLDIRKPCPAYVATALEPGTDLLLEFLLENGMQLECLAEPPLHAFLRRGLASDNYPVDLAIKVAEVLVKHGAIVKQQNLEGQSILDVLDDLPANAASRVAALKEALNKFAVDQPPPPPRTPKILPALSAAATAEFALAPGSPFIVGASPLALAVADFNGDGWPDLAIASTPVMVLLGNGAGGFTAAPGSPFRVGRGSKSVVVGDFNRDGKQDLAILAYSNGSVFDSTVTLLLGNGAGGFSAALGNPFTVVGGQVSGLVMGDFNGDGKPDLATESSLDGTVTVLLGDGTGGFTAVPGGPLKVGAKPQGLAVGDFNRDGWPDLAVAHDFSSNLTLLLGTGAGRFATAPGSPFTVGSRPLPLAVGDFNGDGRLDLAVGNFGGDSVTVLLGNGAGGFTAAPGSPFTVGKNPGSLAVADFNGDGKLDLAAGGDPVVVLLGDGAGGFTASPGSPLRMGTRLNSVAVGDFNGDGKPDLAIANFEDSTVTVLLNSFSGFGLRSR